MCSVYHKGNIVGWLVIWLEEAAAGGRKNFFGGGGGETFTEISKNFLGNFSRKTKKSRTFFAESSHKKVF